MAIIFIFFNFLFYKILSSAMFDYSLTIWASALTAIVVGIITVFSGVFGTVYSFRENEDGLEFAPERAIAIMIGASIVCSFAGYLIALGFSERFYREISHWSSYRSVGFWEQDLFWFCIMISIPVISQLSLVFWRLHKEQ